MRGFVRVVFVAVLLTLVSPTAASAYGAPECDQALPGSGVLNEITSLHIPLDCGPRPSGAPQYVIGWWDGTTIHLYPPAGLDPRTLRKTAAHELGHAQSDRHPDWLAQWTTLRNGVAGSQDAREDFAEGYSLAIHPESGVSYMFPYGYPTTGQLDALRSWHAGNTPPPTTTWTTAPPFPAPTSTQPALRPPRPRAQPAPCTN